MSSASQESPIEPKAPDVPPAIDELTRPGAIARSVAANWVGQIIFIVSGFVLPRLIDRHIGQELLGVWDLGWTTVAYLTLLNAGIASSVNRFVARYRVQRDWDAMNRATSCCGFLFICTSSAAAIVTIALTIGLARILPETFGEHVGEARWVVLFLGLSSAAGMSVAVFNGVITGHQRYDLVMYIETGSHIVAFAGTIVALVLGHGLRVMAVVFFTAKALECVAKIVTAYRICPQLHLSPRSVSKAGVWEVTAFGGKYFVHQLSRITLYQGNSLLIAAFLGPAALAVYARAMGLVNYADKMLFEFGKVLIPSASSLQAQNADVPLERLILHSLRYSLLIALPMILGLSILGASLMRVWMGPEYAELPLLTILAVGHLAAFAQTGPFYILLGMNRHGVPALSMAAAAAISIVTTLVCLTVFYTSLVGVTCSVGGSVTAAYLFVTPWVITRASGLSLWRYFLETVPGAVLAVLPFTLWLVAARLLLAPNDKLVLLAGALGGGAILLASYWRTAVPQAIKDHVRRLARFRNIAN